MENLIDNLTTEQYGNHNDNSKIIELACLAVVRAMNRQKEEIVEEKEVSDEQKEKLKKLVEKLRNCIEAHNKVKENTFGIDEVESFIKQIEDVDSIDNYIELADKIIQRVNTLYSKYKKEQSGGNEKYYRQYLKYKSKYLKLKKELNL
jgi:hypothetical protein